MPLSHLYSISAIFDPTHTIKTLRQLFKVVHCLLVGLWGVRTSVLLNNGIGWEHGDRSRVEYHMAMDGCKDMYNDCSVYTFRHRSQLEGLKFSPCPHRWPAEMTHFYQQTARQGEIYNCCQTSYIPRTLRAWCHTMSSTFTWHWEVSTTPANYILITRAQL